MFAVLSPRPYNVIMADDIKHGTSSGYTYRKCRCDACKEWKRQAGADYYARNAERVKQQAKDWYAKNPGRATENSRAWREANREKFAEYQREYQRKNAEQVNAKNREWRRNNKRKTWAYNWINKNTKRGGPIDEVTRAWVKSLTDDTPCTYCGDPFSTIDHIIPVSAGGTNARDNLTPACAGCNAKKSSLGVEVFLHRLKNEYARPARADSSDPLPST